MDTTELYRPEPPGGAAAPHDEIANNLANADTTGYRAEHTRVRDGAASGGRARRVAFVQDVGTARDLSPGPIEQTGNPLDLAIDGSGYLTFATPGGDALQAGRPAGLDADGQSSMPQGKPLLDDGGNADHAAAERRSELTIAADGTLVGAPGPIARIGTRRPSRDEQALERDRGRALASSEAPQPAAGRAGRRACSKAPTSSRSLEMTTHARHGARLRGHAEADRHRSTNCSARRSSRIGLRRA